MGIKTIKVLRIISKVILAVFVLAFVGYGGLVTYKSIINRPREVRITNITESAATITWVTSNPVRGVVYYNENGFFLPGPLSFIFGKAAYDDRDVSAAQELCVSEFNEKAKNTKDANFSVDGSDFDCENVKITKMGAYYAHSVTILNLNAETKYSFRVGNGIWSWKEKKTNSDTDVAIPLSNIFSFRTQETLESVSTPNIAFGKVFAGMMSEEGYISETTSADSYVTAFLTMGGTKSELVSAVTNPDGGWIIDKSSFRDSSGEIVSDLSNAVMTVCVQYENVDGPRCEVAEGDLTKDTEIDLQGNWVDDLTPYEKSKVLEMFDNLVERVYAVSFTPCPSPAVLESKPVGYSCQRNCGSPSVSGCGAAASCMKKCQYVTVLASGPWYGASDWVKFGTIGVDCDVPSACGVCAGGATKDNVAECTHQVCNSGFWSDSKPGLASGASCTSQDNAGNCNSSNVGACKDGKRCEHDDDDYGWEIDDRCKSDDPCGGVTHNACNVTKTKKCVKDFDDSTWYLKKVVYVDLECPSGGEGGACNASQFSYGCYSGTPGDNKSKKCIRTGGAYVWQDYSDDSCGNGEVVECYSPQICTKNEDTGAYEICDGGKIVSCQPPAASCSVKASYGSNMVYSYEGDCMEFTLRSCAISCTNNGNTTVEKINSQARCLEIYPELEKKKCIKNATSEGFDVDADDINVQEINLAAVPDGKLKDLLRTSQPLREHAWSAMNNLLGKLSSYYGNGSNCNWKNYKAAKNSASTYCSGLGGSLKVGNKIGTCDQYQVAICFSCDVSTMYEYSCEGAISSKLPSLSFPSYAEGSTAENSYALYLSDYGMYSFQLGDYTFTTKVNDGNKYYIFYIEANGKDGFQIPEDPENPTADEDIMLESSTAEITYEKVSSAQSYNMQEGINIVSFNFIPTTTDSGAYMASDVIAQAKTNNVDIKYISTFDGGRWYEAYSCTSDTCTGTDFSIVPGRGYLIYANNAGTITIPGYNLKSSIPVAFSSGWNLVGIHGYTTAYTARTLIDSINAIEGLTANNISWWPTSKGKYEGLQVENSTEYGLDFAISPTNGYFVRISEFAPSDTTCKSILWNDGGTLNGTCGNTK